MNKNKIIILFTVAIILILIGTNLNFIVMIANEGRMPLKWDFYSAQIDEYVLWNETSQVELWFLGDVIRFWIFSFSIGDLFILIGLLITLTIIIRGTQNA